MVWDSIEWEWRDHPQPDKSALILATELLRATKEVGVLPTSASSGKFPLVRFIWQNAHIEVEVFANSFELYVFPKADEDKVCSISEFDATSPRALPEVIEKIKDAVSSAID